jgi:negative regulator of replication initiation
MNHILRLQVDLGAAKDETETIRQQVRDLRRYLQSDKFLEPEELRGYVNIQDVLNRLEGI